MTRAQDAADACAAGADAVGIVFFPRSPRCVTIEAARDILAATAPLVTAIGLFVNAPVGEIRDVAQLLGLTHVQLHGDESPAEVAALAPLRVLKAIRFSPARIATWRNSLPANLIGLLLETPTAGEDGVPGGTGIENDWSAIAASDLAGLPPLFLAGGLSAGNVASVVRRLRPYAVDVSSGIEVTKGIKSRQKMLDFAAAVRTADEGPA